MDEIAIAEKYYRAELLEIDEVGDCVDDRLFNCVVPPKTPFPYAVFQVVPLGDKTGQARTSIMTRLLIDLKFVSDLPIPASVALAVAAVKEHFRLSFSADYEGCRISVRHDRPISYPEMGATAEQRLMNCGGTYAISMHRLD